MFSTIEVSLQDGIGELWLNRPDKLNPLSRETLAELVEAARWFDAQAETRVVVVGGRGGPFRLGQTWLALAGRKRPELVRRRIAVGAWPRL